jgi:hypothetical protein
MYMRREMYLSIMLDRAAGGPMVNRTKIAALLDQRLPGHALPQGLYNDPDAFAFDLEAIRAAVRAAPDQDIYKAWKQGLSRSGVARPPTPEEQKLLRTSRFSDGVSRGLQILGGLGALTAAAAAVRASVGEARPVTSCAGARRIPRQWRR